MFIDQERVAALSALAGVPAHSVLTAAFTHEIGHILLRSNRHALSGIMRSDWGGKELKELGSNLLRFTPQERSQIRRFVLASAAEYHRVNAD